MTPKPPEQVKIEPNVAMVKDLLVDNIDGTLFTFVMKLLELLDLIVRINIDLL